MAAKAIYEVSQFVFPAHATVVKRCKFCAESVWGQPPKVIWLKTRNQSRAITLKIILDGRPMIEDALLNHGQACVEVSGV